MACYVHAALYGQRLRALRRRQHLRLRDVADRIGISLQNLARIEKGQVNTPIETLARVAEALGTTLEKLITATDLQTSSDAHDDEDQEADRWKKSFHTIALHYPLEVWEALMMMAMQCKEFSTYAAAHGQTPLETSSKYSGIENLYFVPFFVSHALTDELACIFFSISLPCFFILARCLLLC